MVVQTSLTKQNLGYEIFLCLIKKPCVKKGTQQHVIESADADASS